MNAYKTRARTLKHRKTTRRRLCLLHLDATDTGFAVGLLALRDIAEAYGSLGMVAEQAGISREALYRSLSPKGNPTLKTLLAVLKSVVMRMSVEPENHAPA